MYKLIASDLDGTLLQNGSQALTPETIPLICRLQKHGVVFTAASGRQYPNLYRLFGEASPDMAFICENGALVAYHDKIIQKSVMPPASTHQLIHDILDRPGCEVLISGEATSYLLPKKESFLNRMQNIVKNNVRIVSSVADIPEDIIKVSVYEEAGIMEHSAGYFTDRWQDTFKCTVSGYGWLDFVRHDVNKGTALLALMKHLGVQPSQTAAFGDNYNDLEMLSCAGDGYVMDNAAEDIRRRYHLHTARVEDTLQAFLDAADKAV